MEGDDGDDGETRGVSDDLIATATANASDATRAAWLLAVDPLALGGAWLRGPAGEVRDAWLATLRAALPQDTPWRRVPLQVDDERLLGGLDLGASLAAGRPVREAGLIQQAAGGLLLLPMAERAPAGLAARLALALDAQADIALLALDEGCSADETLAPVLAERLALVVEPRTLEPPTALPFKLIEARLALTRIPFDEDAVQALCRAAQALGIGSLRPVLQAWRVACVAAACAGHETVEQADAELAARLVLAPRARTLPAPPESASAEAPPPPSAPSSELPSEPPSEPLPEQPAQAPAPDTPQPAASEPPANTAPSDPPPPEPSDAEPPTDRLAEQLIEASAAAIPAGLLAALAGTSVRRRASPAGRSGTLAASASGRSIGARRGLPRGNTRLDLLATLRAAIPWQRLRLLEREQAGLLPSAARLLLKRDDFHVRRTQSPQQTTTVFVVDASGSQAVQRLAEAKGAVELLLADCYVRRDQVALIAFRGEGAQTLLPPTRSLVRARRALSELPGGGGTPLAIGIDVAAELALRLQAREGGRAQIVFLTDARANIDRAGRPGREAAMQDALLAARHLAATGLRSLLIDTALRPQPAAQALAQAMAARYLALPMGQALALSKAIQAGL